MPKNQNRSEQQDGVAYELRTLEDRWTQPMGSDVLSSHSSAQGALDAQAHEPQEADDGTGRSTLGSYVPNVIVRINGDGSESVIVPRPLDVGTDRSGGGRW